MTTSSIESATGKLRQTRDDATPPASSSPSRYSLAISAWALTAIAISLSGAPSMLPRLAILPLIWAPVITLVVAFRKSASFREWAMAIDLRIPVWFHLIRVAFGAAFLVLLSEGRLPASFAITAGYGDLLAGGLSLVAGFFAVRISSAAARRVVVGWNVIALADILVVMFTAQRLIVFENDPLMLATMRSFPFSTIPLFVVPMILLTHALIFVRCSKNQVETSA